MSAASCLLTEDQFLCSICLDVFTDPVTVPCGHNFCKTCITEHWNINVPYQCPNCKKVFYTRPELRINTFISEMAAQFRQSAQQEASSSSSSEQQASKPGEVPCDVCTGTKLKALKSCLVCLASYCETHLEPHLTTSGLKRHQLIDPVENLEDRMCSKHDKLLELFCKTDQTCVCMLCTYSDHKTHDVVPLKEEYEGKKAELMKTEAEAQQMIQKRRLKIQEIKRSVELSKEDADREIAGGVQVFTALKESVERSQAELIDTIKEKQRKTEKQGEGFIKELEQEISELQKRSSEVEQLSQSEDHLHLLQSFLSLNAAPPTKDWTEVSVRPPSYEGTVVRAVNQLGETLSKQMKKLFEAELKRVQQYAADVTLDPDTVHPKPTQPNDRRQAGFTFSAPVAKLGPSMLNWQLATPTAGTAKPATSEGIEDIERLTTGAAAGASSSASSTPVFGLGDAFKKPESAWDCDVCLVQNKDADEQCVACCAPKPGANVEPKGFRLIFSKPAGTWNCDTCLFLNKPDAVKCVACMSAKPASACRAPKPGANVEPKGSAASPAPSANPSITPQPGAPGGRFNFAPPTTFNIRPAMFPTAGQQSLARPRNKTWVQRRK